MKTGNLDGQGLGELQNYKFQNLSSAPTTNLTKGRFYFNTSDNTLYVYNGTAWVDALKQGLIYTGGTGIDISGTTISADFTEVATAAQGDLADSAIQPNDNVSELTNDAGYITSSAVGNGVLTIKRNNTTVGSFSANATSATTLTITVPTTAADVGAVPTSRTVNGKALSSDISLTASDVGALPDSTTIGNGQIIFQKNGTGIGTITANQTTSTTVNFTIPTTASDVGAVPTSRTINGKALTSNITLTAADTGALPDSTTIGSANLTIQRNGTGIGTFSANATSATTVNISVPTTATEVGALPSTTTINDLTSTAQQNALNSGVTAATVTQVATNTSGISAINSLIPSATTASNQLADKAFVNSSVQTATANFRGNWSTWSAVPTSANDYPEDYAGSKTPTVNDYLVVQDASGYTGQTLSGTWRFKYTGTWSTDGKSGWLPEYQVNESPMTSDQLAALNSGVTAATVTQVATNTSAISGLSTSKQDKLTAGSNIQINGTTISATDTIYTLPAATTSTLGGVIVGTNLSINNGVLSADAQSITVDTTLSTTSTNPVQNKVVTSAIQSKTSVTFVDWTV